MVRSPPSSSADSETERGEMLSVAHATGGGGGGGGGVIRSVVVRGVAVKILFDVSCTTVASCNHTYYM